jgi:cytochrome-b5 reductase
VYDVSEYLKDHPGGKEAILEVAGTDATAAYEDVGHSEDAREILQGLDIGALEGAPKESTKPAGPTHPPASEVVQKHVSSQPKESASGLINPRTELAAATVAAAGLAWAVTNYGSLPSVHLGGGAGSFTQGFLAASASFAVIGGVGARFLSQATKFGQDFSSYPAHISSSKKRIEFHPSGVLTPQEYRKYKLRSKKEVSEGIWRFTFDLPNSWSILGLPIGQHIAIKGTVGDHTVVRSYTPISSNRDLGRLDLIIRVYPDGQLGNYLKNLEVGDEADIRGPKGAMRYRKGMAKHIGMVGGGTGITPLFQLIRAICEDKTDDTKVTLIYGNRSEADIMMREQLDRYAEDAGDQFNVYYTLDKPSENWKGGKGHVTKELLAEKMPKPSPDSKIMLCGPPGMVNATKDNLVELGFEGPGAVSKRDDQIFCF